MDIKKWQECIKSHLNKPCFKKQQAVICGILGVDHGVKPALLFDVASVSSVQLYSCIRNATAAGLVQSHLSVLEIDMDVFVVCLDRLKSHLCGKAPVKLVNVSGGLEHPAVLERTETEHIFHTIAMKIQDLPSQHEGVLMVDFPEDVNRTTVFGILLGYPVVYWYPPRDTLDNCLSMVPLTVWKVTASFALTNGDTCAGEIYSFSAPRCVADDVDCVVKEFIACTRAWFDRQTLFEDFRMDTDVVILPAVAM